MESIHWLDKLIFVVYFIVLLGIGYYFYKRNKSDDDYYVGGRTMSAGHIGLSVVATDVGGGFSIGLGGLGFTLGLSGSWMLFTGLLGAWMSSVWLIPKVYQLARDKQLLSFPQAMEHYYGASVALVAGVISLIGYIGFSGSQILAGAKLATATFPATLDVNTAVIVMGVIAVLYTVIGGMKAVIYTDTFQWIILLVGLIGVGIPLGYMKVGGMSEIVKHVDPSFFTLTNVSWVQILNWAITIIPIWFIGMTLYQRIYAAKDEKTAIRAWRIAGWFEWPVMAFMGVVLGLLAKVAYEQNAFELLGAPQGSPIDAEMGLPLFLRSMLPFGFMGLMMSAYFSAIMSTADSCLMAASGNLLTDVIGNIRKNIKSNLKNAQLYTFILGFLAIMLALNMKSVLDLMLYSYAFMVSGLFVPVLAMLFIKKPSAKAALTSMIAGGSTTLVLILTQIALPFGLDANLFGIIIALISFYIVQKSST